MIYKIYANDDGWKQINQKHSLAEALEIIGNLIKQDKHEFIVVERNNKENIEFPIIVNERGYYKHLEGLKDNEILIKQKTISKS